MTSHLDPGQIIKQAFDDASGRLKVDAEVTATIVGPQEVIISDVDDSIKIGNGSGTFAQVTVSNALKVDGSAVTQPVSFAGGVSVNNAGGGSAVNIQDGGNSITIDNTSLTSIDSKFPSQIASSIPTAALARTTTVAGTPATALNAILFSTDVSGYVVAYVLFTATGTIGFVTCGFESSNDNVNWQSVDVIFGTAGLIPATTFPVYSSNFTIAPIIQKVRVFGKYLRCKITQQTGDGIITTSAFLSATDSSDSAVSTYTQLIDPSGSAIGVGQQNSAACIPVVIAADQSAIAISASSLPLPTGAATSALQTQPGVDIGDVTINNATGAAAVNIQDGGNSITVDGTFFQATQPVSATSLPLPTLAATSTKQSDGSQKTQIVDGSGNVIAATSNALNTNITNASLAITAASLPLPTLAATSTLQTSGNSTLTTINTTLGTPFQAGGSIGNTSFAATQATAASLNATTVTTGGATIAKDSSLSTINTTLGTPFQAGGSIGNTAFIANAGTNLNTSALALDTSVTNVQGTVSPGTAATKSSLIGGIFNLPLPTPIPTQQTALQTDQFAQLLISNKNLDIHTELLQELVLEMRAMRFALVALVTEGQRNNSEDFDPNNQNFANISILN